ncbi:hypothetical protein HK405_006489 [Cladochytrium tenue]|nr:hypothetical protein HK405_006489 [Cladochytrium tenue]
MPLLFRVFPSSLDSYKKLLVSCNRLGRRGAARLLASAGTKNNPFRPVGLLVFSSYGCSDSGHLQPQFMRLGAAEYSMSEQRAGPSNRLRAPGVLDDTNSLRRTSLFEDAEQLTLFAAAAAAAAASDSASSSKSTPHAARLWPAHAGSLAALRRLWPRPPGTAICLCMAAQGHDSRILLFQPCLSPGVEPPVAASSAATQSSTPHPNYQQLKDDFEGFQRNVREWHARVEARNQEQDARIEEQDKRIVAVEQENAALRADNGAMQRQISVLSDRVGRIVLRALLDYAKVKIDQIVSAEKEIWELTPQELNLIPLPQEAINMVAKGSQYRKSCNIAAHNASEEEIRDTISEEHNEENRVALQHVFNFVFGASPSS